MIYEWIVETFQYVVGEFLQLILRQIQCFHQFIEHYFVDIFTNNLMFTSFTHNIHTRKISNRRKNSVRAIQQSYLTFVVRSFRRNKQHIQSCLISRELFGNFLRSFNHPQMEDFSLNNQVIIVLQFFFDSSNIFARESRNNTVYQCCIYATSFFKPSLELITQVPQFNILINSFFQLMSIQENKFARENNQTLCFITIECFETMIQQLSQFTWIR